MISVILLMVMVIIIFSQVFTRFVLDFSIRWSEELARYLMIWMVYLAGCTALRKGQLIGINFFIERFPRKYLIYIEILTACMIVFFLTVMTVYGAKLVKFGLVRQQLSPALQIPMGWIYLAIPISGCIMILFTVCDLVLRLVSESNRSPEEPNERQ
jgi:TRAP-type C4-dicarboxylate transport system permease small subunit